MKTLALALLACLGSVSISPAVEARHVPANGWLIETDWQSPDMLPRRFRNHCVFDVARGRFYCSDHCGIHYQFYYCSRLSFGCCRVGFGYCDWEGLLRCHP